MSRAIKSGSNSSQCKTCAVEGKNTGYLTDALGPFPDEPFFSAVDRTLILSCGLYYALNGVCTSRPALNQTSAQTEPFTCPLKETAIAKAEPGPEPILQQKSEPKKPESWTETKPAPCLQIALPTETAPVQKRKSNLKVCQSQSLSNLGDHCEHTTKVCFKNDPRDQKKSLRFNYKKKEFIGDNLKVKSVTTQGFKTFEIWSNEYRSCPSMVFVLSQASGQVVCFENIAEISNK